MVNKNANRDHRRIGVSCTDCLAIAYCGHREEILSSKIITPDYARYGCTKYKGVKGQDIVRSTRPGNQLLSDLKDGRLICRDDSMFLYGITGDAFDSILARLRKKGHKIMFVKEGTYALDNEVLITKNK